MYKYRIKEVRYSDGKIGFIPQYYQHFWLTKNEWIDIPDFGEYYEDIDNERDYQDAKWGGTRSSNQFGEGALDRTIDEYVTYINGYTNELVQIASHTNDVDEKLNTIRKIAGLCVACMERHGAPKRKI